MDSQTQRQDRMIGIIGLLLLIPVIIFIVIYARTDQPQKITLLLGGVVTLALYSVLYRENPVYRMAEHIFIGLGVGYTLMIIWTEILGPQWFDKIKDGQWLWLWAIPLAIMAYFVFSKKHGWISRIPLGILLGFIAGQQFQAFAQQYFPQIRNSFKPLWPTMMTLENTAPAPNTLSVSGAINNLIFVITLLSVLTYFLFAFEQKNKGVRNFAQLGRWLIMIGFGAIFGSTIMTRFALFVDRAYFLLIEWLRLGAGGG